MRTLILLLSLCLLPAAARESELFATPRDRVSLISAGDAYRVGDRVAFGIRFRAAPGWNLYWKNPGDAGEAPSFAIAVSGGAAGAIGWPTPRRQPEQGIMTYGYSGEVVLPFSVSAGAGGGDLTVRLHGAWLICKNVCVPEKADLSLRLPQGDPRPSAEAPLIAAAQQQMPRPSPFAATLSDRAVLTLAGEGLGPARVRDAWFFPDAWGPIDSGALQGVRVEAGAVALSLTKGSAWHAGRPLSGVVVLRDPAGGESALAITATPATGTVDSAGWALLLLPALLGGLILNLMPCVFPILAMKAMAAARLAGAARATVRREAGFYTLGVVASFVTLGLLLWGLRAWGGGEAWGFQFQQPLFVTLMAALMLAVGLNLLGVFQVRVWGVLPRQGGDLGSLCTGALAVLLATPCTAPFMAVAIAGALAAPAAGAAAVFAAMGLGMAAPYGLLAVAPGLAALLPRPGAWMVRIQRALALPMFAVALWLLWVAQRQIARAGLPFAVLLLIATALGLVALGRRQRGGPAGDLVRHGGMAAIIVLIGLFGVASHPAVEKSTPENGFSPAKLATLRAQGRPVFVDMTASWCVTCLVNERVALDTPLVRRAFARRCIAYLRGDWTQADPVITRFLHDYGRDGVPLYVYFPPDQAAPVVLPQILTAVEVLNDVGG